MAAKLAVYYTNGKSKIKVNEELIKTCSLSDLRIIKDTLQDYNRSDKVMLLLGNKAEKAGVLGVLRLVSEVQKLDRLVDTQISHNQAVRTNFNRALGWNY